MSDIVTRKWREGLCPLFDGVMRADGTAVSCGLRRTSRGVDFKPTGARTSVDDFLHSNPEAFSAVNVLCACESESMRVQGGEGSRGGDGFLAVTDTVGAALVWILFSQDSNPFVEVALDGSDIVAVSTFDDLWRVPFANPERATVSAGSPAGWDRRRPRLV